LIWFPVLLHQILHRGILVFLIWLFIAPVATNLLRGTSNPFFETPTVHEVSFVAKPKVNYYLTGATTIAFSDLIEPTRLLLSMFFLVFLLNALVRAERFVHLDGTEIWMGIFSLLLLISTIFQSKRLAPSAHVAIDAFIVPFLAYFVARRLITSTARFHQLIKGMGYMGLYLIFICFIERLVHQQLFYRLGGPFQISFPLYLVMTIVFLSMLLDVFRSESFLGRKQNFPHAVRWFALCLTPVVILLTWSRAYWVGFIMAVTIFLYLVIRLLNPSRKLGIIGVALLLVPVTVSSMHILIPDVVFEKRISDTGNVLARIGAWKITLEEAVKAPIFGVGLNNLRDILGTTQIRLQGVKSETTVHNSILSILTELGAIGLIAYLAIIISLILMGLRLYSRGMHSRDQWRGAVILGVMTAYLVPTLFANELYRVQNLGSVYIYAVLGGIAGLYSRRQAGSRIYASSERNPIVQTYQVSRRHIGTPSGSPHGS
jgi:putative inorganic carbon (hco3(-)) transporter